MAETPQSPEPEEQQPTRWEPIKLQIRIKNDIADEICQQEAINVDDKDEKESSVPPQEKVHCWIKASQPYFSHEEGTTEEAEPPPPVVNPPPITIDAEEKPAKPRPKFARKTLEEKRLLIEQRSLSRERSQDESHQEKASGVGSSVVEIPQPNRGQIVEERAKEVEITQRIERVTVQEQSNRIQQRSSDDIPEVSREHSERRSSREQDKLSSKEAERRSSRDSQHSAGEKQGNKESDGRLSQEMETVHLRTEPEPIRPPSDRMQDAEKGKQHYPLEEDKHSERLSRLRMSPKSEGSRSELVARKEEEKVSDNTDKLSAADLSDRRSRESLSKESPRHAHVERDPAFTAPESCQKVARDESPPKASEETPQALVSPSKETEKQKSAAQEQRKERRSSKRERIWGSGLSQGKRHSEKYARSGVKGVAADKENKGASPDLTKAAYEPPAEVPDDDDMPSSSGQADLERYRKIVQSTKKTAMQSIADRIYTPINIGSRKLEAEHHLESEKPTDTKSKSSDRDDRSYELMTYTSEKSFDETSVGSNKSAAEKGKVIESNVEQAKQRDVSRESDYASSKDRSLREGSDKTSDISSSKLAGFNVPSQIHTSGDGKKASSGDRIKIVLHDSLSQLKKSDQQAAPEPVRSDVRSAQQEERHVELSSRKRKEEEGPAREVSKNKEELENSDISVKPKDDREHQREGHPVPSTVEVKEKQKEKQGISKPEKIESSPTSKPQPVSTKSPVDDKSALSVSRSQDFTKVNGEGSLTDQTIHALFNDFVKEENKVLEGILPKEERSRPVEKPQINGDMKQLHVLSDVAMEMSRGKSVPSVEQQLKASERETLGEIKHIMEANDAGVRERKRSRSPKKHKKKKDKSRERSKKEKYREERIVTGSIVPYEDDEEEPYSSAMKSARRLDADLDVDKDKILAAQDHKSQGYEIAAANVVKRVSPPKKPTPEELEIKHDEELHKEFMKGKWSATKERLHPVSRFTRRAAKDSGNVCLTDLIAENERSLFDALDKVCHGEKTTAFTKEPEKFKHLAPLSLDTKMECDFATDSKVVKREHFMALKEWSSTKPLDMLLLGKFDIKEMKLEDIKPSPKTDETVRQCLEEFEGEMFKLLRGDELQYEPTNVFPNPKNSTEEIVDQVFRQVTQYMDFLAKSVKIKKNGSGVKSETKPSVSTNEGKQHSSSSKGVDDGVSANVTGLGLKPLVPYADPDQELDGDPDSLEKLTKSVSPKKKMDSDDEYQAEDWFRESGGEDQQAMEEFYQQQIDMQRDSENYDTEYGPGPHYRRSSRERKLFASSRYRSERDPQLYPSMYRENQHDRERSPRSQSKNQYSRSQTYSRSRSRSHSDERDDRRKKEKKKKKEKKRKKDKKETEERDKRSEDKDRKSNEKDRKTDDKNRKSVDKDKRSDEKDRKGDEKERRKSSTDKKKDDLVDKSVVSAREAFYDNLDDAMESHYVDYEPDEPVKPVEKPIMVPRQVRKESESTSTPDKKNMPAELVYSPTNPTGDLKPLQDGKKEEAPDLKEVSKEDKQEKSVIPVIPQKPEVPTKIMEEVESKKPKLSTVTELRLRGWFRDNYQELLEPAFGDLRQPDFELSFDRSKLAEGEENPYEMCWKVMQHFLEEEEASWKSLDEVIPAVENFIAAEDMDPLNTLCYHLFLACKSRAKAVKDQQHKKRDQCMQTHADFIAEITKGGVMNEYGSFGPLTEKPTLDALVEAAAAKGEPTGLKDDPKAQSTKTAKKTISRKNVLLTALKQAAEAKKRAKSGEELPKPPSPKKLMKFNITKKATKSSEAVTEPAKENSGDLIQLVDSMDTSKQVISATQQFLVAAKKILEDHIFMQAKPVLAPVRTLLELDDEPKIDTKDAELQVDMEPAEPLIVLLAPPPPVVAPAAVEPVAPVPASPQSPTPPVVAKPQQVPASVSAPLPATPTVTSDPGTVVDVRVSVTAPQVSVAIPESQPSVPASIASTALPGPVPTTEQPVSVPQPAPVDVVIPPKPTQSEPVVSESPVVTEKSIPSCKTETKEGSPVHDNVSEVVTSLPQAPQPSIAAPVVEPAAPVSEPRPQPSQPNNTVTVVTAIPALVSATPAPTTVVSVLPSSTPTVTTEEKSTVKVSTEPETPKDVPPPKTESLPESIPPPRAIPMDIVKPKPEIKLPVLIPAMRETVSSTQVEIPSAPRSPSPPRKIPTESPKSMTSSASVVTTAAPASRSIWTAITSPPVREIPEVRSPSPVKRQASAEDNEGPNLPKKFKFGLISDKLRFGSLEVASKAEVISTAPSISDSPVTIDTAPQMVTETSVVSTVDIAPTVVAPSPAPGTDSSGSSVAVTVPASSSQNDSPSAGPVSTVVSPLTTTVILTPSANSEEKPRKRRKRLWDEVTRPAKEGAKSEADMSASAAISSATISAPPSYNIPPSSAPLKPAVSAVISAAPTVSARGTPPLPQIPGLGQPHEHGPVPVSSPAPPPPGTTPASGLPDLSAIPLPPMKAAPPPLPPPMPAEPPPLPPPETSQAAAAPAFPTDFSMPPPGMPQMGMPPPTNLPPPMPPTPTTAPYPAYGQYGYGQGYATQDTYQYNSNFPAPDPKTFPGKMETSTQSSYQQELYQQALKQMGLDPDQMNQGQQGYDNTSQHASYDPQNQGYDASWWGPQAGGDNKGNFTGAPGWGWGPPRGPPPPGGFPPGQGQWGPRPPPMGPRGPRPMMGPGGPMRGPRPGLLGFRPMGPGGPPMGPGGPRPPPFGMRPMGPWGPGPWAGGDFPPMEENRYGEESGKGDPAFSNMRSFCFNKDLSVCRSIEVSELFSCLFINLV